MAMDKDQLAQLRATIAARGTPAATKAAFTPSPALAAALSRLGGGPPAAPSAGARVVPAGRRLTIGKAHPARAELTRKVMAASLWLNANPDALRMIELFSGAGGATIGTLRACREMRIPVTYVGVQKGPLPVKVSRAAGHQVVQMDVRAIAGPTVVPGGGHFIDLLRAGAPCQPYASGGDGLGEDDPREMLRFLKESLAAYAPRRLLVENVMGLLERKHAAVVRRLMDTLQRTFPHSGMWKLKGPDFGVPSDRNRVYFWGAERPLKPPKPTHGPGTGRRHIGAGDVLPHLRGQGYRATQTLNRATRARPLEDPAHTITSRRTFFALCQPGLRWPFPPSAKRGARYRPEFARILKPWECAALMAFPPDYPFEGTLKDIQRMVGNAEPPPMAAAVSKAMLAGLKPKGLTPLQILAALSVQHTVAIVAPREMSDPALIGIERATTDDYGRSYHPDAPPVFVGVYSAQKLTQAIYDETQREVKAERQTARTALAQLRSRLRRARGDAERQELSTAIDRWKHCLSIPVQQQVFDRFHDATTSQLATDAQPITDVSDIWSRGGLPNPIIVPEQSLDQLGLPHSVARFGSEPLVTAMLAAIMEQDDVTSEEATETLQIGLADTGESLVLYV